MLRVFKPQPSVSQSSSLLSSVISSTCTRSTSLSSLPLSSSHSFSSDSRRMHSSAKYMSISVFLLALVLLSLLPSFRLIAHARAAYLQMSERSQSSASSLSELQKSKETKIVGFSKNSNPPDHLVAKALFEVLHDTPMASFIVYPCHEHTIILEELSHRFRLESSQNNLTLLCLDSSSRDLAQAHGIVREKVRVFSAKFKRHDPLKKSPPPADLFVSVRNDHNMKLSSLRDFIRSVRQSGIEKVVLNAWPADGKEWELGESLQEAPFPCSSSILRLKPIDNGYIVVYDVHSFTNDCIDPRTNGLDIKTKD